MTNKKQIGREAELRFAAELTRKGWEIFLPYGEDNPIDILAHKDNQFLKIQVKATKPKNGKLPCKLRSTNNWQSKKYTEKEIDSFGIYDHHNKKGYLISMQEVKGMSEISLRLERSKNNQKKSIRDAKKYLYFE